VTGGSGWALTVLVSVQLSGGIVGHFWPKAHGVGYVVTHWQVSDSAAADLPASRAEDGAPMLMGCLVPSTHQAHCPGDMRPSMGVPGV
jgi:hypothetical protein